MNSTAVLSPSGKSDRKDVADASLRSTIFARPNQVANQQLDHLYEYYETGAFGTMSEANISAVETRKKRSW